MAVGYNAQDTEKEKKMFDINEKEIKQNDVVFGVEKLSGVRKALIALLGVAVVAGAMNGYMNPNPEKIKQTSTRVEKIKTNPVFIKKSNKMPQINEQTR